MTFQEQLVFYITELGISQKELSEASGLSNPTISRYCAGTRVPEYGSAQILRLSRGLSSLSAKKRAPLQEHEIRTALNQTVGDGLPMDYEVFLKHLSQLMTVLGIRGNELARALNYDPSHISKILSGTRKPGNLKLFADETVSYIVRRYADSSSLKSIALLTGAKNDRLRSAEDRRSCLITWLGSESSPGSGEPVSHFLEQLDSFDLNEYMKAIRFDDLKLPPAVPQLPLSRTYCGIQRMMDSELDFMRATVLSRSAEDCIMYSDMPLQEMASDPEFPKKWMFGMAMLLKKGLHLHIIHDVNRPFPEMMLGLEGNIPMYMTGQISPYYLPASQSMVFSHLLKVSGAAALEGSAITGHQNSGKYVLYRSPEDIRHYRRRAKELLRKARPLMDIYRSGRKDLFLRMLAESRKNCDLLTVCSSLPLFTVPEDLLRAILGRTALSASVREEIRAYHADCRSQMLSLVKEHTVRLMIPDPGDGTAGPEDTGQMRLSLSELFIETDIPYSSREYMAHRNATLQFAAEHPNLVIERNPCPAFRNISFSVVGSRMVIVSKEKSPAIHFVIYHKKMVQAFLNFIPPIVE